MKILLTGATGTLGRALVPALERAGHTVRIASRGPQPPTLPAMQEWAQMDVETGAGVAEGVAGADAVIHAASDPRRHASVDVNGMRTLIAAAKTNGTRHLVYVSIVGIDEIPFAYYRSKLECERLLLQSGLPCSLLRATQFHELVDQMISACARVPLLLPLPMRFLVQSVATGDVSERLVRAVAEGPRGRLPDFGGPEVLTFGEAAAEWKAARGVTKPVIGLPLPGGLAAAFRAGRNTVRDGERGTVRWREWLRLPGPDPLW